MATIVLQDVTKRWGQFYAVDHLNLEIGDNAFVTLLGPSGCGKTTTLRMIAGLETPTSGRITIDGVPVFDSEQGINVSANKRKVGFLFQNYALWPNMTVYQNIAFGLSNIKEVLPTVDEEACQAAKLIDILRRPDEMKRILRDAFDQRGRLEQSRALLRLIDSYEISMTTARMLLGYHIHEGQDAQHVMDTLNHTLSVRTLKQKAAGYSMNERYELLRDGQVVTSLRKLSREEIDLTVRRVSRIVKIGMFMERYPSELSGGQQQRVAIARTLAPNPKVLFMDEPLSNLDAKLRLEMRSELQRLHVETGSTFIYVTHDQMEAMTLATKICLIDNGVLQQYDEPLVVYNRPANLFVADFVGSPSINFINANGQWGSDGSLSLSILEGLTARFVPISPFEYAAWKMDQERGDTLAKTMLDDENQKRVEKRNIDSAFNYPIVRVNDDVPIDTAYKPTDNDYVLGIRPEFIDICDEGEIEGEVFSAMPTGMETTVRIRIGDFLLTGVMFGGVLYKLGENVRLSFHSGSVMLFSRQNGHFLCSGSLSVQKS